MSASGDADEWGISERIDRLEAIAETLEDGEIGLERAKELREEADEHLDVLREELDVGDGEIIEMDAEAVDVDGDES
ncbi:exodeoxyribonuclease VII small subunit [Haloglomus salinum]|uniref:exodeoxyribonuclease VII small subunit n=1 Tax=Haloglomus salinum TaxID=2962673 RepID=UPI0020C9486F|nr:exodeoxyribonuclease VII small subunit [Haloglomus salinum]